MAEVQAHTPGPGRTAVDARALERIALAAIGAVPGTLGDAGGGLSKLTGRSLPRVDIGVDASGTVVTVDAEIAVAWPAPVGAVAARVRDTIITWFAEAAGVTANSVDVRVAEAHPDPARRRVGAAELAGFDAAPGFAGPAAPARPAPARPKATRTTPVRAIAAPPPPAVRGIAAPAGLDGWTPATPAAPRPRRVTAPERPRVVPVRAPAAPRMRPVAAPPPVRPRPVAAPPELRPVTPTMPLEPRPLVPRAPRPVRLARPRVAPARVRRVSAPPPPRPVPPRVIPGRVPPAARRADTTQEERP
ncbi:Asp23/Gls24 family envelope stress response protein [Corynebacterium sphenisci]|uniref:Asp23/Gls24 family envelope stress response protein n=1 Tax=Corynebacterium sphenisci TaxID=191493 RepID=UPI0009523A0C|nr:Asp23/Gls24 family envelope stress response protein [Corynebacterium sphenisci]